MLKPIVLALSAAFSLAAFCQPARSDSTQHQTPPERAVMSSASAAPSDSQPCDLMSPEEMRECLATKPHKPGRSAYCDQVSKSRIESCLQQRSAASGASTASNSPAK
jgi:hypothetical protein